MKPTCSDPACEKPTLARGMCVTHYHRWNRATSKERAAPGVCRGCGEQVPGSSKTHPAHYCGPDCRPRCSVEDCAKPRHGETYCSGHHTRWKRHGDPLAPLLREPNVGSCSVEECEEPSRKRGWCAGHYEMWRKYGQIRPWIRKWGQSNAVCVVCSMPTVNRRKYCSASCQQVTAVAKKTGAQRPPSATCKFCQQEFSLLKRTATGRLQRTDTIWCPDCGRTSPDVQRFRRYGVTKDQYDAAQAAGCPICLRTDRPLHVDHDHACCPADKRSCGECVRGFICGPCNRGLGLFFDDINALRRAADYLDS